MKVLDPQTALLTTAELHQFLNSSKPRTADKKIGAYSSVNIHDYLTVKQDVANYVQSTTTYTAEHALPEIWMKELTSKLRKYDLTKTEAFNLINLGVGFNEVSSATSAEDEVVGEEVNGEDPIVKSEAGEPSLVDEKDAEGNDATSSISDLDRMLFGLVVEEADERFAGDDGEERITDIIRILRETIAGANGVNNGQVTNGA